MKKLTTLLFIICFASLNNSFGQVSYTSANYASAGDSTLVTKANVDSIKSVTGFEATGANSTWDFTNLLPLTQFYDKYLSAANTGYKVSFLTSCIAGGGGAIACNNKWTALVNLGHLEPDSVQIGSFKFYNEVEHYYKSTGALPENIIGLSFALNGLSIPFATAYTIPDTVYRFPLNYGNSDSCTSYYTIDLTSLGVNLIYKAKTKRVNHVDGWGKLTTPYKVFSSTIKLRTELYNNDTLILNGAIVPIPATEQEVYSWFDASSKIPVIKTTGNVINGNVTNTSVEYIDTVRCLNPLATFTKSPSVVYLDAGTGMATVSFNNTSNNANIFSWNFDDAGSGSANISTLSGPSHTYTAGGTYKVQLVAGNNICDPVRYDTVTIPVVVIDSTQAQANFTYTPLQPCTGDTIHFTNTSLNADTYLWSFGDKTTSTTKSPKHGYATAGSYTITLVAQNNTQADTLQMQLAVLAAPIATVTPSGTINLCGNDSVILRTSGGIFYLWSNGKVADSIIVKKSGSYAVQVYNTCGNNTSPTVTVTANPLPAQPAIQQSNDTLISTVASSYQWILNNQPLLNDTGRKLIVSENGMYQVQITDTNGCAATSDTFGVFGTGINVLHNSGGLSVYPNPTNGNFTIQLNFGEPTEGSISIVDLLGNSVLQIENGNLGSTYTKQVNLTALPAGVYFLQVKSNRMSLCERVVKL